MDKFVNKKTQTVIKCKEKNEEGKGIECVGRVELLFGKGAQGVKQWR